MSADKINSVQEGARTLLLAQALDLQDLSELTGSHSLPVGSMSKAPVAGTEAVTPPCFGPSAGPGRRCRSAS